MSSPTVAAYGTWQSSLTPADVAADSIRLGHIVLDGDDVYWVEARPQEGGRNVVVRRSVSGEVKDCTPQGFNVRTRVHEYGGAAYTVYEGVIFFVNFADQRLYRQEIGEPPQPISQEGLRYADFCIDAPRNRLIGVREDHRRNSQEPVNSVVAVPMDGGMNSGADQVLVEGYDFFSTPRLDPTGRRLVWLAWNHPDMPWTTTELWSGRINEDGALVEAGRVAGGERESIFQPAWSPAGELYFVSDRSGWWNLYRLQNGKAETVVPMAAEFGRPQWVFGEPTYGFADENRLICSFVEQGVWRLAQLDAATGSLREFDLPYSHYMNVNVNENRVVFEAGGPQAPPAIVSLDLSSGNTSVLRRSSRQEVDPNFFSMPQNIEFPTEEGKHAYAFYYPPANAHFVAPEGEKPPLVVFSHGGPTSATNSVYDPAIQYWTSRGIAVVDVNYGGSTGYGREYRERLTGKWGIVDLDDCANAARYLVSEGLVDPNRLAIRGGSAGGYTTLAMLAFRDLFHVGASYFGVSDLGLLAEETHKFESRYLDSLVGPYPARKDIYDARSPIHGVDKLACPIIFFQGDEDAVVPPNQAEIMVEALRQKGIPVAYLLYAGEQHGFRKAENVMRSLEAELYFYGQILGFVPADEIEPVEIDNFPAN